MRFKSILEPDKYGYNLDENDYDTWNKRGQRPLLSTLMKWETLGDGNTQHTPGFCAQFSDTADACLSLASAILAEPHPWTNPHCSRLTRNLHHHTKAAIKFAFSVKYKEGKLQFYSIGEAKISGNEKLRYDKRFEEVAPWMNGTGVAAFRLIAKDYSDFLPKLILAEDIHDHGYAETGHFESIERIFPLVAELPDQWHSGFMALYSAIKGIQYMDSCSRSCECMIGNLQRDAEYKAQLAAAKATEATPATA